MYKRQLLEAIGQGSLCLARLAVNQADLLSCLRDEGRPNLIAVDLAEQIRTLVEVCLLYTSYKKYLSNLPPFQEAAVLEYAMDFRGELTRFSLRLERGNLQQQTAL